MSASSWWSTTSSRTMSSTRWWSPTMTPTMTTSSCPSPTVRGCRRGRARRNDGRLGHHRRRDAGRQRRVRVLRVDLHGQVLPLSDQFLFLLDVIDGRDGGRQRLQLVLRGIPLALVDQLLYLGQLLRGERHLIGARLLLLAEQRRAQPIHRIAGTGAVHDGTETAQAQQRSGDRAEHGHRHPRPPARPEGALQRDRGVVLRRDARRGRPPHLIAPARHQVGQLGVGRIGRVHRLLGAERVQVAVRARNGVQRRIAPVCAPATEIRHGRAPSR